MNNAGLRGCYVLEAAKLLHYAGDITRSRSGLLLWTDNGTNEVHFAVRYWLYAGDFLYEIPFMEIEFPVSFRPGYMPQPIQLRLTTDKFGNSIWQFACPHCRIISSEKSYERLILTHSKTRNPFFGCYRCHRRSCRNCQRNPSASEHRQRDWGIRELWGGGYDEFLKDLTNTAPTFTTIRRGKHTVGSDG